MSVPRNASTLGGLSAELGGGPRATAYPRTHSPKPGSWAHSLRGPSGCLSKAGLVGKMALRKRATSCLDLGLLRRGDCAPHTRCRGSRRRVTFHSRNVVVPRLWRHRCAQDSAHSVPLAVVTSRPREGSGCPLSGHCHEETSFLSSQPADPLSYFSPLPPGQADGPSPGLGRGASRSPRPRGSHILGQRRFRAPCC